MENKPFSLFNKHSIWITLIAPVLIGVVFARRGGILLGPIFIFPVFLVIDEFICFIISINKVKIIASRVFDAFVLIIGPTYEWLYIGEIKNATWYDWPEQLYNAQRHTPIYTGAVATVMIIFLLAILGYIILQYTPLNELPPLVAVLSMAAMYLGIIQLIILTVQVFGVGDEMDVYLFPLPACCILITARTIVEKIYEWNDNRFDTSKLEQNPVLKTSDTILKNVILWPFFAIFLMIPLLGILIAILYLFGQAPDSVIKAWTETSQWNLSTKISPQNIYYDEHYLCTVAAGGHRRVVKPIRKGIRHGHEVTVNRQLCIANAFEQILEEKTPHLHRAVRAFYDKYGFPVARLIKSRWIADAVYFIMKPLEWFFLIVIYMVDVHPENRIAVQYMGDKTPLKQA
ncbi:hypothetical protein SAMN04487770_12741 [Butyrivibrio sp. ob235]|uniref:DUF6688 domain-containing protein n=1 Tax=Butyrivibrio sp. ob235 TaxID=1761780 RepID=UPI0008BD98D6|nr:DUF6688 family protein [Butyrivibrio sp. ob235]SEM15778.1 hypothetical protein SAMN04487770_12741 [Butyrivibrio sp. ob235]